VLIGGTRPQPSTSLISSASDRRAGAFLFSGGVGLDGQDRSAHQGPPVPPTHQPIGIDHGRHSLAGNFPTEMCRSDSAMLGWAGDTVPVIVDRLTGEVRGQILGHADWSLETSLMSSDLTGVPMK
jgi:hypothetical protein